MAAKKNEKCSTCGACKECGAHPAPAVYPIIVYPQPAPPLRPAPWQWPWTQPNYISPNTGGGTYTYAANHITGGNYVA